MKFNGVIVVKIEHIEERVQKLRNLLPLTTETLRKDYFLKSGIERTLQVCVEAVIDIAERIIALKNLSPVTTSFAALRKLEELGILLSAEKYRKMVQFRNFIVHRYESVADEELVSVCNDNLKDFDDFIREIQNYESE
ncbi:MAG: DUF86 domain-containing protein [Kiritimatiellaeota bacterium]|nr:DUF86 domain-containing protein [Kiritimatiellota bacterium]